MGVLDRVLDVMKLNGDDDEYDDDFYDDDDDFEDEPYEEEKPKRIFLERKINRLLTKKKRKIISLKNQVVQIKSPPMRQPSTRRNAPAMEVCVIKPNAMDDTREITETLPRGKNCYFESGRYGS